MLKKVVTLCFITFLLNIPATMAMNTSCLSPSQEEALWNVANETNTSFDDYLSVFSLYCNWLESNSAELSHHNWLIDNHTQEIDSAKSNITNISENVSSLNFTLHVYVNNSSQAYTLFNDSLRDLRANFSNFTNSSDIELRMTDLETQIDDKFNNLEDKYLTMNSFKNFSDNVNASMYNLNQTMTSLALAPKTNPVDPTTASIIAVIIIGLIAFAAWQYYNGKKSPVKAPDNPTGTKGHRMRGLDFRIQSSEKERQEKILDMKTNILKRKKLSKKVKKKMIDLIDRGQISSEEQLEKRLEVAREEAKLL